MKKAFEIKYHNPTKIRQSDLSRDYCNRPSVINYERSCSVVTKFGIVIVQELRWDDNFGGSEFTYFITYKDGMRYTASIKKADLSDRMIKYASTHIAKHIQFNHDENGNGH